MMMDEVKALKLGLKTHEWRILMEAMETEEIQDRAWILHDGHRLWMVKQDYEWCNIKEAFARSVNDPQHETETDLEECKSVVKVIKRERAETAPLNPADLGGITHQIPVPNGGDYRAITQWVLPSLGNTLPLVPGVLVSWVIPLGNTTIGYTLAGYYLSWVIPPLGITLAGYYHSWVIPLDG
ncbi:hypothetical protein C8R42DRAFT_646149 [Lentinula raphanica]|nr:hypothetical protein C8R42DRAFT_646149 [Lentinula raphanica]